jgi:hypothetical protein
VALPFYDFDHRGASALFASPTDLVRFGLAFLGTPLPGTEEVFSPQARTEMADVTPFPKANGEAVYGLGINVRRDKGELIYSHSGGMPGVAATLTMWPEKDLVIAIAINTSRAGTQKAMRKMLDQTAQVMLERDLRPVTAPVLDNALAGSWSGTIETAERMIPVSLTIEDDQSIQAALNDGTASPGDLYGVENGAHLLAFAGIRIPSAEAARYPHGLLLRLTLRGNTLSGAATAIGPPESPRMGSALSYWIEMQRGERP